MNSDLEQKLWSIGEQENAYSQENWQTIINELLNDFQTFIGEEFERETEPYLSIKNTKSPSFSQWIWSRSEKQLYLAPNWSAVMGGGMVGSLQENNMVKDIFQVSLTLFLFDPKSGKRLHLSTGESLLEFAFLKQVNGRGQWQALGWRKDEWGEWEDVEYQ
ncbi:hypothetical protein [Leptolyngbya sp. 7M]|uniref:hypothetical protein n=1 Tax=Leptolyngbya sp. 7M TaxID=2812896 RepID=UPI001B8AFDEC|nr:hypothetical protein [Leptolyngbya sp. 7M]QYO67758.1 hypothetical protein JVX88_13795 [Leptolyngbya sp. 7M]